MLLIAFIVAAVFSSPSNAQGGPPVQVDCPGLRGAMQHCSTNSSGDIPPDSWMSNLRVKRGNPSFTSGRLEWELNRDLPPKSRYRFVWQKVGSEEEYFSRRQPSRSPEGASLLSGLETGTTYQVMVCTPDFNTSSDLPPPGANPFIPECGYCIRCFMTEQPYFKFDETYVMRLNSTYVELICEVESNVNEFSITWSVAVEEGGERMVISNGDVIEGKLFLVDIANSTPGSVTSILLAPDIVLDQDVQCMATSEFASRSSEEGAFFEEEEGDTSLDPLPVWAIFLVALAGVLTLTCMVVAAALTAGIVYSCCHTRERDFEAAVIKRKISESNEYLDAKQRLQKLPLEEMPHKATELDVNALSQSALRDVLMEDLIVDSSLIRVTTIIGQGEYGVVYKGLLRKGSINEVVAVKSLKGIFATEHDIQAAIQEIVKMKDFKHPHVMSLIGVSLGAISGGAPAIIMPYMARGSLLSYLRKERDGLLLSADVDVTQVGAVQKLLMQICLQISQGMAYLASLRFVHRDLAARNCMIDDRGVIKVADFGLAEDIYMRNYFRQSSQDTAVKLPLKWMAPESIKLGIFSEKSDVWSYGVTCWEVFTAGEIPYPGIHAVDVVQLLGDGRRLNRPHNQACSNYMFALMQSCWKYDAQDRPDFVQISSQLDDQLTAFADYIELAVSPRNSTKVLADTVLSLHD